MPADHFTYIRHVWVSMINSTNKIWKLNKIEENMWSTKLKHKLNWTQEVLDPTKTSIAFPEAHFKMQTHIFTDHSKKWKHEKVMLDNHSVNIARQSWWKHIMSKALGEDILTLPTYYIASDMKTAQIRGNKFTQCISHTKTKQK